MRGLLLAAGGERQPGRLARVRREHPGGGAGEGEEEEEEEEGAADQGECRDGDRRGRPAGDLSEHRITLSLHAFAISFYGKRAQVMVVVGTK